YSLCPFTSTLPTPIKTELFKPYARPWVGQLAVYNPPMPEPLISVLMSVRNGMPYVEQTVQSILAQTFADWEFIIVDNASTDGSADAIERISKTEPRITLIRNL